MRERGYLPIAESFSPPPVVPGYERELILLRTKLEVRSWFLRVSLSINTAFLIYFLTRMAK